jgi:PAS domain S-box-containing protein
MSNSIPFGDNQIPAAEPFPFVDLIDSYWEWDVANNRTVFSPLLHKLTGYTAEEVASDPQFWNDVVHQEDRKILKQLRKWALQRNAPFFETKLRLKSKSGKWLWYLIRCTIAQRNESGTATRVSGVMFDVSEQETFKSALHETGYILRELHSITTSHELPLQERLNRILAAGCEHFGLPNGIVSHVEDDQYEVLAVYTPGDSIKAGDIYPLGKTFCNETLQFGGAVYFEDASLGRFKTHPCYLEFGLATYIGIPIEVDDKVYGTLNFSAPAPRGKIYNATDNEILKLMGQWIGSALTRKMMGQALLDTERQFQNAQRLETVGRLVSGVAHDINNLLTAIIGYIDLARIDLPADDPIYKDLNHSVAAAKRGARITRRLVGFSKPAPYSSRAIKLDEAITDTRKLISQMAGGGVQVTTDLQGGDALVRIDPAQFDQVLMNLAVNSRDAMPMGGTITIATRAKETEVVITFSDTGSGMDKKTVNRIFEPFFTTKNPEVGTGLGLATVHSIITKADGSLTVQSETGKGTTFKIGIPLAGDAQTAPPKIPSPQAFGLKTLTVLLIEGEELVRQTVSGYLEKAGHKALVAENGNQANDLWARHGADINLILSDVTPPGSPGWDFPLTASFKGRHPLLLFMSAYPKSYLEETGHPTLHYPVLEKPFDYQALTAKLGQILG